MECGGQKNDDDNLKWDEMRYSELNVYERAAIETVAVFAVAMAICAAIGALCGCTRKVYVPVESVTVRTDTVETVKVRVDSVRLTERIYEKDLRYDSVAPIIDSLNRVIGWDRWHFRESTKKDESAIYRLQSLVDSLRAVKRDSVDRPVPCPVERKLTRWERVKMDAGGMAIGVGMVLLVVVIALVMWLIKVRKHATTRATFRATKNDV